MNLKENVVGACMCVLASIAAFAGEKPVYYLAFGDVYENDGDSYSASSMDGTYQSGYAN